MRKKQRNEIHSNESLAQKKLPSMDVGNSYNVAAALKICFEHEKSIHIQHTILFLIEIMVGKSKMTAKEKEKKF